MNIVNIMTIANVPIMLAGVFGLNEKHVRIDIARKYTLAALVNCINRLSGAQESKVYFVVLIEFCVFIC